METKFVREEGMTLAQQAETVRNNQAYMRLLAEVREAARQHDVSHKHIDGLLERARIQFPISNGEFKPVADWVAAEAKRLSESESESGKRKSGGNFGPVQVSVPHIYTFSWTVYRGTVPPWNPWQKIALRNSLQITPAGRSDASRTFGCEPDVPGEPDVRFPNKKSFSLGSFPVHQKINSF